MKTAVGIDIGSTTAKIAVVEDGRIIYKHYEKHFSKVREKTVELLTGAKEYLTDKEFSLAISGSSGLGIAKAAQAPFVQEVFATSEYVRGNAPDVDVAIELGGEDAKILFFNKSSQAVEERMNGSCAGGTGAFIDQMATLLDVDIEKLDRLSLEHKTIYTIASRCGVFAKTDIQPLINQGARKEDIAASIFQAVVDQTITGLAQGHKITGKVMFLGGPLYFLKGLGERFVKTLKLTDEMAVFPPYGLFSVALGAASYGQKQPEKFSYNNLLSRFLKAGGGEVTTRRLEPLFADELQYEEFRARHERNQVAMASPVGYTGDVYVGIDCGSTTTKLCVIDSNDRILYSYYSSNRGNPVDVVKEELKKIYALFDNRVNICGAVSTGYGEELIKNAFSLDAGLVETMAHLLAARHFDPKVDFVLDIGGQDIKCFKIQNGAIDDIILNEACSSGCGSFIETFAKSLGKEVEEFAKVGLFAKQPVDLGSRCTVFMNSSVKQSQKEGAGIEDISAGLSVSVVKNAIYKVIRANNADELGSHIVVQGGTFLNDAILRGFEREIDREVTRPNIAGLMGAFGAALFAKGLGLSQSGMIGKDEIASFSHRSKPIVCGLCNNRCNITVNMFENGRKFLSGNRCQRPLGENDDLNIPNMIAFKNERIRSLVSRPGSLGKMGIPMGLNMYENIFFWHTLLTQLGFEVVLSDPSSREGYRKGQDTIPSDTVCYPAKLMHGHVQNLIDQGVRRIFYPCLPYNFNENTGDNHYNCPVVAYYPELLEANMDTISSVQYYSWYFGLHRPEDFKKKGGEIFGHEFGVRKEDFSKAAEAAYKAHENWRKEVMEEGRRAISYARKHNKKIIMLAGRPYHIDGEINHGIDQLINSLGFVIITEDSIPFCGKVKGLRVLNQWTYHARLYNAARYVMKQEDMELVQMVSFGCGLDAITTDEVRRILEKGNKLYTQLKIDEINNLGAVRIRLRSLMGAIEERSKNDESKQPADLFQGRKAFI
jgi:predicted CoA-substrate-specific enzyme activase